MGEHLAHWLSEHPALIDRIKEDPNLEGFLNKTPVEPPEERVNEQEWHEITQKLQE